MENEMQSERLEAINKLLTDYSKSQSAIIHDLRNAIIIISVMAFAIISLLVGYFCWYSSQFEDVEETRIEQQVDTGDNGGDTIVNGIGDINYGKDKANDYENKKEDSQSGR